MSKRFAIIAAALVAAGRTFPTSLVDRSEERRVDRAAPVTDELSIEERSRLAFADFEDGLPEREMAEWKIRGALSTVSYSSGL
jgi:hypothetical protein